LSIITSRLRTIVAVGAVGAGLVSSGVASAASVIPPPGTGTTVVASQPTTVARYIDPVKTFSAGIAGYSDGKCEQLAGLHNSLEGRGRSQAAMGNSADAQASFEAAGEAAHDLQDNCVVID
jgi:hypothetical protein